jgi:3-phenylpropionate/trans-cinnamate dioxygenase ferredoxin subunit
MQKKGDLFEAAKIDELELGQGMMVEIEGKELAIFNCDGEYYAIDNECTHVGGPLCEGELDGGKVICPWHGAEFDLKSGEALEPPAEEGVNTYKVHIDGDLIKIEL